jgi:hypothetical protein
VYALGSNPEKVIAGQLSDFFKCNCVVPNPMVKLEVYRVYVCLGSNPKSHNGRNFFVFVTLAKIY